MNSPHLTSGFRAKLPSRGTRGISPTLGLTLLEMMLALSIIGITTTLVVPSAQNIFIQNRIISEQNRIGRLLQYARLQALETKQSITVCPSNDYVRCSEDWTVSKIVFADVNNNSHIDGNEVVLISSEQSELQTLVSGPDRGITFHFSGTSASPGTIKLCDASAKVQFTRALFVSLQGRVSTSKDSDGDNVHEKNNGKMLRCE